MSRTSKYMTVVGASAKELDEKVNVALNAGWELYMAPYPSTRTKQICQAMFQWKASGTDEEPVSKTGAA